MTLSTSLPSTSADVYLTLLRGLGIDIEEKGHIIEPRYATALARILHSLLLIAPKLISLGPVKLYLLDRPVVTLYVKLPEPELEPELELIFWFYGFEPQQYPYIKLEPYLWLMRLRGTDKYVSLVPEDWTRRLSDLGVELSEDIIRKVEDFRRAIRELKSILERLGVRVVLREET